MMLCTQVISKNIMIYYYDLNTTILGAMEFEDRSEVRVQH